jgi:hypothetical protein
MLIRLIDRVSARTLIAPLTGQSVWLGVANRLDLIGRESNSTLVARWRSLARTGMVDLDYQL